MAKMEVFINRPGDGPIWPELQQGSGIIEVKEFDLALVVGGMKSGNSSVMLRVDLPDGRTVLAETSLALLKTAMQAFSGATNE